MCGGGSGVPDGPDQSVVLPESEVDSVRWLLLCSARPLLRRPLSTHVQRGHIRHGQGWGRGVRQGCVRHGQGGGEGGGSDKGVSCMDRGGGVSHGQG